ncbi:hypothetical protein D9M68_997450 [compost metagenome]
MRAISQGNVNRKLSSTTASTVSICLMTSGSTLSPSGMSGRNSRKARPGRKNGNMLR